MVIIPENIAFPATISPKIQPTLHISTAFEYLWEPKSISGALYHLVATYSVRTGFSINLFVNYINIPSSFSDIATLLARPKSATFI
jgi:hypothetical protein